MKIALQKIIASINFTTIILCLLLISFTYYLMRTPQLKEEATKNKLNAIADTAAKKPSYETYLALGLAAYNQKQFQKSIEANLKAISFNKNSPVAYNNLCSGYNELQQYDKAIEACNNALKLDSNFTLAKNNLNWAIDQQKAGK